jgi:ribosomal protein S18 acetylase RimI-like enzyme
VSDRAPRLAGTEAIRFRDAGPADAEAIGRLHADSWRRHYRGAYPDSFLDGDVEAERITHWRARLGLGNAAHRTIVAEAGGDLVGFVHVSLDGDPRWGALLDNLHVGHAVKRQGVGTELMSRAARVVAELRSGSGMFLWVLTQNTAAQAFYVARGGVRVEEADGPTRGGVTSRVLRYVWSDPGVLVAR